MSDRQSNEEASSPANHSLTQERNQESGREVEDVTSETKDLSLNEKGSDEQARDESWRKDSQNRIYAEDCKDLVRSWIDRIKSSNTTDKIKSSNTTDNSLDSNTTFIYITFSKPSDW